MNRKIRQGLQWALIAVFIFSLGKIGLYCKNQWSYNRTERQVEANYTKSKEMAGAGDVDARSKARIQAMKREYPNLSAWMEIPGTSLSLPVVQGKDNDFYLNHDINDAYNALGVPFMDYRNKANFSDDNTIIYGHRVRNGKVFYPLTAYEDPDFVRKAPEIILDTEGGRKVYQIFAVYRADPYEDFRSLQYEGEKLMAFRSRIEEKNVLKEPVNWNGEKILTLQTCSDRDERLVVHGKLVER
ncbi:MAG: class B sortase [Peptoniphilus sp.]|nr:class B sortase [Peptoniphilus sp.]MDY3118481.1 class B sortase [Peptoniphilus sp.]